MLRASLLVGNSLCPGPESNQRHVDFQSGHSSRPLTGKQPPGFPVAEQPRVGQLSPIGPTKKNAEQSYWLDQYDQDHQGWMIGNTNHYLYAHRRYKILLWALWRHSMGQYPPAPRPASGALG